MAATYLISGTFWLQTLERAVKTFAQAAIALLGGDGFGLIQIDIGNVFSVAALAAVVSILTSLASGPFTSGNSPSLVPVPESRPGRPRSS
jgi:hypothetical protein